MSTPHTPLSRRRSKPTTPAADIANTNLLCSSISTAASTHSFAHNAAMNTARSAVPTQRIHQLPGPVSTRIQTSLVHTTLPSVLRSLLHNALDAGAPTISFTLHPQRRAITVTDTGPGILPDELPLVGKMHHTSKHPPVSTRFGSKGIALASLATHSILTLTSRAEGWRSAWTKRWVYGRELGVIREEGSAGDEVGTRVRVEGIWGDMPVRARQEIDPSKAWEDVQRTVVETLCGRRGGWQALTKLIGRDENGAVRVHVRRGDDEEEWDLKVLRQVWGVDTPAWEPVRGKLGGVRVDGWVSNRPVMGRKWQVVLVDGMSDGEGLSETVNRGFRNAGFENGVEKNAAFLLRIEGVKEGGERGRAEAEELCRRLVAEWLKVRLYKPVREKSNSILPQKRKPEEEEKPKTLRKGKGKENTAPTSTPSSKISSFFIPSKPGTPTSMMHKSTTPTSTASVPKEKILKPVFPAPAVDMVLNTEGIVHTDSNTGKHHILDPRTGNLKRPSSATTPSFSSVYTVSTRLSLPPPVKRTKTDPSPFISSLLAKNPTTFPAPPPPIPASEDNPVPTALTTTLTSESLRTASIIGQVDKKLILVRAGDTLTIIDQHAASERVRVEHLYATLSSTPTALPTAIPLSSLLPEAEIPLLSTLRPALASWGLTADNTNLTALPQLVVDRRASKEWLASFVRRLANEKLEMRRDGEEWVQMMRRVPAALKEVVESRSCRGAVMFGDELTQREATELVRRLAGTRWPWICAHGRRGVVPLISLGARDPLPAQQVAKDTEKCGDGSKRGEERERGGRKILGRKVVTENIGGSVNWTAFTRRTTSRTDAQHMEHEEIDGNK